MPRAFAHDRDDARQAELDVRARVGELPIDYSAMVAMSNVFRVATAARKHMEKSVLADEQLSWSGFTALFVLWVWGAMETNQLAEEVGITRASLSSLMATLERRGLCTRSSHPADGRLVTVGPTAKGNRLMKELFPKFNAQEALLTQTLTATSRHSLASSLRAILRTIESIDGP